MNFKDLSGIVGAYKASRILHVAAELKIFDVVASEARTAGGIAEVLKTEPRATELFCNALAGMGLLEKTDGKFRNSEVSQRSNSVRL